MFTLTLSPSWPDAFMPNAATWPDLETTKLLNDPADTAIGSNFRLPMPAIASRCGTLLNCAAHARMQVQVLDERGNSTSEVVQREDSRLQHGTLWVRHPHSHPAELALLTKAPGHDSAITPQCQDMVTPCRWCGLSTGCCKMCSMPCRGGQDCLTGPSGCTSMPDETLTTCSLSLAGW